MFAGNSFWYKTLEKICLQSVLRSNSAQNEQKALYGWLKCFHFQNTINDVAFWWIMIYTKIIHK